jgi:hypothetical protein
MARSSLADGGCEEAMIDRNQVMRVIKRLKERDEDDEVCFEAAAVMEQLWNEKRFLEKEGKALERIAKALERFY